MSKEFHRFILLTAALILICAPPVFSAEILTGQPLVVIDPGHDTADPGLQSETGDREAALTLTLAQQISKLLSDTCRVHLTRTSASPHPEAGGTELANHEKADLFLSIHLHNRQSSQPIIYFFALPEDNDAETWQTLAIRSQDQSKKMARTMAATLREKTAGIRPLILSGPVLPLEGLNMPGILIEPFAISQIPADPHKRETFLTDQARTIADALSFFLKDRKAAP